MTATYPTKLYLAMFSGGICAFESCRKKLTSEGTVAKNAVLGEAAHIYGEKEGAARYKPDMSEEERNHHNNLLYLCPTCHTKIDKQEADHPAKILFELKEKHESWVKNQLDIGMTNFSFADLELAVKALSNGQYITNGDFTVISPEEKIVKNNLSCQTRQYLLTGISRSSEVADYLTKLAQIDNQAPDRLKNGFKAHYHVLAESFTGDALFMQMFDFATKGAQGFTQQAAGLAILTHLFEICEVFKK
jgi:hypothetical protein